MRRSHLLADPLVSGLLILVLLASAAGILQGYAVLARRTVQQYAMEDFGLFYASARQFVERGRLYGPLLRPGSRTPSDARNLNPPHTNLLFLPLLALTPHRALIAWLLLNALFAADIARIAVRELRLPVLSIASLAAWVYVLAWAPTAALVITGQLALIVAWPMTRAWRAARHGNWDRAGVWLGVAASMKIFLLVFFPMLLLQRRWRPLAWAMLLVTCLIVAGAAVFSPRAYVEWVHQFSDVTWQGHYMNASLWGILARALDGFRPYLPVAVAPGLVLPSWAVGTAALLGVTWARSARREVDADCLFALLIAGALLASPLGWVYYCWLGLVPAVAAVRGRVPSLRTAETMMLAVVAAGLLWHGSFTAWLQPHALATLTLASVYFWAILLLWCWLVRASRQHG